jgi:hypothetical protein
MIRSKIAYRNNISNKNCKKKTLNDYGIKHNDNIVVLLRIIGY